ncbi:MAG TPA: molybdopterin cofactor-binding domain-containing protein [Burkholderiales bacterium]|nr:molybdopterin cofactor-binding domain-containing protein [Burkholderiales bacterium]
MLTDQVSRRDFLKGSGALIVTFAVAPNLADAAIDVGPKTVALDRVDGFVAIDGKGMVTVYSGKVDLGTGTDTALTQMAAEELGVPMSRVKLVTGDTLLTPDQGPTFGSLTIQSGGMQIRQACATAREALLDDAARKLGVAKAGLVLRDGVISAGSTGKRVAYGALVGDRRLALKVDPKAPTKDPATYTIVGKPVSRLDIPEKVTGRFTYMQDFKVPGMLHARVVRPAAMKAALERWNDAECKKIPGYIGAVRKDSFLAVVARDEWAAIKAARAIDAGWSNWAGLPDKAKLWDYVRNTKVVEDEVFQKAGNTAPVLAGAAKTFKATYDFAVHTHGSMGPSCAIADFKDGKLTVWTASQATHLLRKQLAQMFNMTELNVRCIYLEGSGCYGRNGHEDAAADAALVAKEVGKPVRVQWSRADEHGWDPKGPPTLLDYRGALDASGNIAAWESEVFIPARPAAFAGVTLVAADLANLPRSPAHPGNIHQSLAIPYALPNIKATAHWLTETPFRPSWIRTPGRMQNTYGNECFLDELATAAGVDPLEYRIRNLKDPRGLECLERLRKLANWTPRTKPTGGSGEIAKGRGVSYIKYELVRTYVGVVADVEVNRRTGKIRVERFHVAHDCGQIINPDGLRNQIDGNVIQTVSRTLIEDLQWNRSSVTSLDWETYPILRFPDVPEIAYDLIDRPKERPWGVGEPTAAVVPSAISNAVYDAVGIRMRSVPFTPDKVLAALKTA